MTEEQQRIAIAEACPNILCKFFDEDERERLWHYMACRIWHRCKENDPLQDLNAMHEAETSLDDDMHERFLDKLYEVCNPDSMYDDQWKMLTATAAQRAKAFLKTLNLWKD